MSVAEHAENILSAWIIADQQRLEAELKNALSRCKQGKRGSGLESERHELLESIAEHFQRLPSDKRFCSSQARAPFALLRHLTQHDSGLRNTLQVINGKSSQINIQIRH